MYNVTNWGWIASIAVKHYPSAGEFLAALALAQVAIDAAAVKEIMRVFTAHTPVNVVRSPN